MTQPTAEAIAAARKSAHVYNVPASVTLAQWALESAWGKKTSGPFNFFGMKALAGQPCVIVTTHENYKGHNVQVQAAFRAFASCNESFDAHAKLLATGAPYAEFRRALPDLERATAALGGGTSARPRYATDPHYGDKLMAVIRGSRLTQYDL